MRPTDSSSRLDEILGRAEDLPPDDLAVLVQRLARERRLLETVFNTIREGILVVDRRGVIRYTNAAAIKLLGFRRGDVGTLSLRHLLPELARTIDLASLAETAGAEAGEAALQSREIEISYPERRYIRVYLVPMENGRGSGADEGIALIATDITEEKISTEERLESERVASIINLAAGVAHELGNPLNSLTIHLQLMRRSLAKIGQRGVREKLERSLETCASEVSRLDGIITHFLEAVRPQPLDLRELDLMGVLEEVLGVMEEELSNADISVEIALENRPPEILADRDQMKQVFFNLLKNAREAMPGGGEIRVTTRTDDDYVYLLLGDSGSGIRGEDMAKVFQPYFTTKSGGTGLGMMIVQRIMREHGGQIGIDSREGVGTVVTIQLPQKHRRARLLDQ